MRLKGKDERRRFGEAGATMVEFALTVLLTLLLVLALLDFGLMMFYQVNIQHATAEGARYGVTGQQAPNLTRKESIEKIILENALVWRSGARQLDIEISQKDESGRAVDLETGRGLATLTIDVTYPHQLMISSLMGLDLSVRLKGHAVMLTERFR